MGTAKDGSYAHRRSSTTAANHHDAVDDAHHVCLSDPYFSQRACPLLVHIQHYQHGGTILRHRVGHSQGYRQIERKIQEEKKTCIGKTCDRIS